jgi:hypothetical protein
MPINFGRPLPPSLTVWNRVEPRPRSNLFGANLSAQVRDPAWFLARQWQMGEAQGEDAASASFVSLTTTTTPIDKWLVGATVHGLAPGSPLERQALAEPFPDDDLGLQIQIAQIFDDLLAREMSAAALPADAQTRLANAFRIVFPIHVPTPAEEDPFNPLDASTRRFLSICGSRGYNGATVLADARATPTAAAVRGDITNVPAERTVVFNAYKALISWVDKVWGSLGPADPPTWVPERLEYQLQVSAGPAGSSTTLAVHPDSDGELHWSSFDLTAQDAAAAAPQTAANSVTVLSRPIHLRFRSMPAPRFWDFETNEAPLPSVKTQTRDLAKLLALDFMLVHGEDWFVLPFTTPVGSIVRVDSLLVNDVFGGKTLVQRADKDADTVPKNNRFSLFSSARIDPTTGLPANVARIFVSPPSAGPAMQIGRPREDVRFARDEMANMAWGIERVVTSPIGEPRPGGERDGAVDKAHPVSPPPPADPDAPLQYLVETKVPVNYIPLIGVQPSPASPAIVLQKGAIVRPSGATSFDTVDAVGKILRPAGHSSALPYTIFEEEIPRTGLTVQRAVYRTRWIDGSTHVWIARRRQAGSGEAQSGLSFDQPIPTAR